jgi:hypothetical protein
VRRLLAISVLVILAAGCTLATYKGGAGGSGIYRSVTVRPPAPLSIIASPGDGGVNLTWTLPFESKTLPVEIDRWTSGGKPVLYKTLAAGTTTFGDTGLTNGTKYFYLVVVKDKRGVLSCCRATTVGVPAAPAPPPAAEVSASDNSADSSSGGQSGGGPGTFYYRTCWLVSLDQVTCPECAGSGSLPGWANSVPFGQNPPPRVCYLCGGSGKVMMGTFKGGGCIYFPN